MRHVYQCSVRFDDLDTYGHVNNVTFAEYLQEARVDFAHRNLAFDDTSHWGTVVVYQTIDYLEPVPFRTEPLQVEVWVVGIGRSSFELGYQVRDMITSFARATSTLVAYDVRARRTRQIEPAERSALEPFVEATP